MPQLLAVTVPPPIVEEMLAEHINAMITPDNMLDEPEVHAIVARAAEDAGYRTIVNTDGVDTVEQQKLGGKRRRVIITVTKKQAQRLSKVAHYYRHEGSEFSYFGWPPGNLRASGTLLQGRISDALFGG